MPEPRVLRVGHSPDPDDAFMFYALLKGKVALDGFAFQDVVEPIEDLNRRALAGELEVTALSAHAYARCADRYWIMSSGASVGRRYGPLLVAKAERNLASLAGRRVALPGELTTAALVARLILPAADFVQVRFDEIPDAVLSGRVEAGVIIHEGQLTWKAQGLANLLDFGVWWADQTGGLPLPLGLDAIRADLGMEAARAMDRALKGSIAYAFDHAADAMAYARSFGRGIDEATNDAFVRMYVNQDTRELPPDVREALGELYRRAAAAGILPAPPPLRFVDGG